MAFIPPVLDPCPLCEQTAAASFEHVPPRSAGNRKPINYYGLDDTLLKGSHRARILQQGHGFYSLCRHCNNWLGNRYGRAFSDWEAACVAERNLAGIRVRDRFYPQRIAKGAIAMFVSANSDVRQDQRILAFLRDPAARKLPPPYRLYAFCRQGPVQRVTGNAIIPKDGGDEICVFSEVHTSAIGYVLAAAGRPVSPSYLDISYFADFGYQDEDVLDVSLDPLVVATDVPGDYRNELMIARGVQAPPVVMGVSGLASRTFHLR